MRWRAEVSRLMVPVRRPGGAPGQLVLADLVGGQRGGPRVATEEGNEMGGPAASGAVGPELPDLVVLEVGVDEAPQGRPLGAEGARWQCRAGDTGGGGRAGFVRGHGLGSSSWWRPRAGGVRPHSLWWARQASGMCDGEGTAMWGEPRVAAECTCTERESGRCSRPTVRPGRNVNDEHDHGDGSSTRPRGRWTSGSLTETRVRD